MSLRPRRARLALSPRAVRAGLADPRSVSPLALSRRPGRSGGPHAPPAVLSEIWERSCATAILAAGGISSPFRRASWRPRRSTARSRLDPALQDRGHAQYQHAGLLDRPAAGHRLLGPARVASGDGHVLAGGQRWAGDLRYTSCCRPSRCRWSRWPWCPELTRPTCWTRWTRTTRTARAKGASEGRVIARHAFSNTLVSLLTVIGLQVGFLLTGAVYVEVVFSWPGIGFMMVNAILTRDFPLVQGGVCSSRPATWRSTSRRISCTVRRSARVRYT